MAVLKPTHFCFWWIEVKLTMGQLFGYPDISWYHLPVCREILSLMVVIQETLDLLRVIAVEKYQPPKGRT